MKRFVMIAALSIPVAGLATTFEPAQCREKYKGQ